MVLSPRKLKTLVFVQVCILWLCHGVSSASGSTTTPIPWHSLPPDKPYDTTGYEADDGGLDPYFALAKSFINVCLPEDLPIDTVKGILDGTASIMDEWQGLAKKFAGFAACVVIGILFFLLFPLVGCCFCCCRCCGRCGGKRLQPPEDNSKCKRLAFSAVVFAMSAFVTAGVGCTYVTSDQLHQNLGSLADSVQYSVHDVQTFVDNIYGQFDQIGIENFDQLRGILTDYVRGASGKLSEKLISKINAMVALDDDLKTVSNLRDQALTAVTELEDSITLLHHQQNVAVNSLPPAVSGNLVLPDDRVYSDTLNTSVATFKQQVQSDVVGKMEEDLDVAIANKVNPAVRNIDVDKKFIDIQNTKIKPMLKKVEDLKNTASDKLANYRQLTDDYTKLAEPYDQYRWYAGIGLASFLALISALMLVAVVMGMLCGSAKDKPTQRGAASNCAGIMLMAAVGLIFIFGSLLMLLTTLMYLFGSLTERYVCQSIDDLSKIEKYTSQFPVGFDLKNISFDLNGQLIQTSLSSLMDGCEKGQTLYSTLKLQSVVDDSLQEITDYKNTMDVSGQLNANQIANAGKNQVDVTTKIQELKDSVRSVAALKNTISTGIRPKVISARDTADQLSPGAGTAAFSSMLTALDQAEQSANRLGQIATNIQNAATALETKVNDALSKLNDVNTMEPVINQVKQDFINELFDFVDSYTDDVRNKLKDSVAKCSPVYSIFHAVFAEAFCHGIVDPLNGFWLALGWCMFFFIPSIIFSVKLAKHFRTMLEEDEYSDPKTDGTQSPPNKPDGKASPPLFPPDGNKVQPLDF